VVTNAAADQIQEWNRVSQDLSGLLDGRAVLAIYYQNLTFRSELQRVDVARESGFFDIALLSPEWEVHSSDHFASDCSSLLARE